jgi:hypothetical protein
MGASKYDVSILLQDRVKNEWPQAQTGKVITLSVHFNWPTNMRVSVV